MGEARCPACGKNFFASLLACSHCGATSLWKSTSSAARSAAPPKPDLARPRLSPKAAPPGNWGWVRIGLTVFFIALLIFLLPVLLDLILLFIPEGEPRLPEFEREPGTESARTPWRGNLFLFGWSLRALGGLIALIGMVLISAVPRESGLRGRGLAVRLLVLGTLLVVPLTVGLARAVPLESFLILSFLSAALALTASLWFFLLLRAIATYFNDATLGNGFLGFFILALILGSLFFALSGFLIYPVLQERAGLGPDRDTLAGILRFLGCGGLILGLVLQVWLLSLIQQSRRLLELRIGSRI